MSVGAEGTSEVKLGKWEKLVLSAIAEAPEYVKLGVYRPDEWLSSEQLDHLFKSEREDVLCGRPVHTIYLHWCLKGENICRSTLSRALSTLERKELVCATNASGTFVGDRLGWGKYRKYYGLTTEGKTVTHTLTNAKRKC